MKKALSIILAIILTLTAFPLVGVDLFTSAEAKVIYEYNVGDIIEFGSYPQSEVTDTSLLSALNSLSLSWASYGYYSGTGDWDDGQMTSGDYMKYADVTYKGERYRAVKFTEYRPYCTGYDNDDGTYQDDNGYYTNTVYWFKFEPLEWRVLDSEEGFMMCESIIDSQPYNNTVYYYNSYYYQDTSCTNYANDYATSSIRDWLNDDFYNTAFSDVEKSKIQNSTQDNSCYNSNYPQYDSDTTNDKIFLLSYDEAINSEYGFSESASEYDVNRRAQGTDYAKAQGLYTVNNTSSEYHGNSWWWLRSPDYHSGGACGVDISGCAYSYCYVYGASEGVRPALKLNPTSEIEHTYEAVITPPTCTEQGYTTYTCECGDTYKSDYVDAKHSYTSSITTPATHLATGVMTYTCTCGDSYTEEITKTTEHTYEAVTTAPTCTEQGYTTHTCACGDSYVDNYVDAKGHSHTSSITTPATHIATGVMTYTCTCGDSYTEEIAKTTEHTYETVTTPPTCTTQGYTTYTCECGDTYTSDYVDSLGHNIIIDEAVSPDCLNTGLTAGEHCSRCDYKVEQTVVDALGHNCNSVVIAPTCTAQGYTKHTCTVCGDTYGNSYTDATGHAYTNIIMTFATCTEQGYTTYTCECGDTYTSDYVDALGHNIIIDEAVAPDCLNTGLTAGEHCSRCDYRVEQIVVDALGHNYSSVVIAPTCTAQGYTKHTCTVCGDTYGNSYTDATGHAYTNIIMTFATCTEQGYTTYTCECGDTYMSDYVDALGHNYENGACAECGNADPDYYSFSIQEPSVSTIRYNDGIILHASIEGALPEGAYIRWTADNKNFKYTASDDGVSLTAISSNNGDTTFYAIVYSADGEIISSDSVILTSNAGFFQKIGGFFRSLFGSTTIYES